MRPSSSSRFVGAYETPRLVANVVPMADGEPSAYGDRTLAAEPPRPSSNESWPRSARAAPARPTKRRNRRARIRESMNGERGGEVGAADRAQRSRKVCFPTCAEAAKRGAGAVDLLGHGID